MKGGYPHHHSSPSVFHLTIAKQLLVCTIIYYTSSVTLRYIMVGPP